MSWRDMRCCWLELNKHYVLLMVLQIKRASDKDARSVMVGLKILSFFCSSFDRQVCKNVVELINSQLMLFDFRF